MKVFVAAVRSRSGSGGLFAATTAEQLDQDIIDMALREYGPREDNDNWPDYAEDYGGNYSHYLADQYSIDVEEFDL
jgi:hypothetical protein